MIYLARLAVIGCYSLLLTACARHHYVAEIEQKGVPVAGHIATAREMRENYRNRMRVQTLPFDTSHARLVDVVVVLGGGMENDGSLPEDVQGRINTCIGLYKRGIGKKIICSSGITRPNIAFSEAQAMQHYIETCFPEIPAADILLEEQSKDTVTNAVFSRQIADTYGFKTLVIVTSDYHLERAMYAFDFVFGHDYVIVGAAAITPTVQEGKHAIGEAAGLIQTRTRFVGIPNGDLEAIKRRAKKLDPKYQA